MHLKFDAHEDALFSELIFQTIIAQNLGREPERVGQAMEFTSGEYVGGWADMSVDQQIHTMLECAGAIDSKLRYKFDTNGLRKHLVGADRFGIDLNWTLECFLSMIDEHHPLSGEHPIFSFDEIDVPVELQPLFAALIKAGYASGSAERAVWGKQFGIIMALEYWAPDTCREDVRQELSLIYAGLPADWRDRIGLMGRYSNPSSALQYALTNHWYCGTWHDSPIRGQQPGMGMRFSMYSRACYILRAMAGEIWLVTPGMDIPEGKIL